MKKILAVIGLVTFFVLLALAGFSQYSPSTGTGSNKPYAPAQATPTDSRSYYFDPVLFKWRQYRNTAEVISYLNLSKYRDGQTPIYIHIGGTLNGDGTFTGGYTREYWFKNNTSDTGLIAKDSISYPLIYDPYFGVKGLDTSKWHSLDYAATVFQGKLTLTTTGSSGAATLVGNTLNIPQYSGGSSTDTISLSNRIDWKQRVYNVVRYGADSSGTTDATAAIQAAINDCMAHGGGIVYFPNGHYKISGALQTSVSGQNPNSQLYIPPVDFAVGGKYPTIKLLGESAPTYDESVLAYTDVPSKGVILESTITGSGTLPAVIGCKGNTGVYNFSFVDFSVENITILTKNSATGPTVCGIKGDYFINTDYQNVRVDVDTPLVYSKYPTTNVFGISGVQTNGGTVNYFHNVIVSGYKYGIVFGEHAEGDVQAFACQYALCPTLATHSSHFNTFKGNWCNEYIFTGFTGSVAGAGGHALVIDNMNLEVDTLSSSWWKMRYIIGDSLHYLKGRCNYSMNLRGGAELGSFPTNDAIFFTANYDRENTVIKGANVSGTNLLLKSNDNANGKIYFGGAQKSWYDENQEKWAITNTGTFFSPTYPIHVKVNSTAQNGIVVENTNSASFAEVTAKNDQGDLFQVFQTGSSYSGVSIWPSRSSVLAAPASGGLVLSSYGSGPIDLTTGGLSSGNLRMRINSGGNLLYNTTTAHSAMLNFNAGIWQQKDSVAISSAGTVMSLGIDTVSGRYVRFTGGGGGGGTDNTNIGSGYRWLNPSTQGIRTAFPGYGILVDSTSNSNGLTIKVDSATLASYFVRLKDSNSVYITPYYLSTHQITSNPGVYFSPAEALDPSFIVIASCIPRTNSYSFGTPIVWSILDHSSQHNSSFMDSVYGGGSNQLVVRYPPVKTVLNTTFVTDESFAGALAHIGPSTDLTTSNAYVYQPAIISVRLTGNGGSSWTKSSSNALSGYFDVVSVFSAGATVFNILNGINIEYDAISIQYQGDHTWHIKRLYTGLGSYNVKFILLDEFNNIVTDNPTSTDEIIITGGGMAAAQLNMTTWNVANSWMPGFANWWIDGIFECWEVAAATSSSSIQVRWQNYPAATNYKIYRATSLYGARTLVHTGTDNSFIDTGLSAGTLYWYFMVATLSGVDTDITYFRTSTNP